MSTFPSITGPADQAALNQRLNLLERQLNPPVPQARIFNSANFPVASSTATAITFDSERWDEGDFHSTSSNTSRLTAPVAGLYEIGGAVRWVDNNTGYRQIGVRLNGATYLALHTQPSSITTGFGMDETIATQYRLAAGDYVELIVAQSCGVSLNVLALGNFSPEFWMVRLAGFTAQVFD